MKQIGTSPNGIIVEMSQVEMDALNMLKRVADGGAILAPPSYWLTDADYEPHLNAVIGWCRIKENANTLRHIANEIDTSLKMPPSENNDNAT